MKISKHFIDTTYVRNRRKHIIQKTVLLEGSKGQGIDGHILALLQSKEMTSMNKVYVAVVKEKKATVGALLLKNNLNFVKLVDYQSADYFEKLARCEFLINDTTFSPIFNKRAEQKYSIIWHGTPLKHLGKDIEPTGFGNVQNNFLAADHVIVSNIHTKNVLAKAFNLENISPKKIVVGPSPRNAMLFATGKNVYDDVLTTSKNYLYLPTWRDGGNETYISYFAELDQQLTDEETFFVKLHPLAKKENNLDFSSFKHIKEFPNADLYQFIPMMDGVVTDYSSIFFDLFNTNKKIVLFNYDKEDYFSTRGVYEEVKELGLPECQDIGTMMNCLRSDEGVNYTQLAKEYAEYDNPNGHDEVLAFIFHGKTSQNIIEYDLRNNKENVVIFAGGLWDNGISKALFNFIDEFETDQTNIILMIENKKVAPAHQHKLVNLAKSATYIERHGDPVSTLFEKFMVKYYTRNKGRGLLDKYVSKYVAKVYERETNRFLGPLQVEQFIHFTGFDASVALLTIGASRLNLPKETTIFCHTDMLEEFAKKGNFNKKIIADTYQRVNTIAVVNEKIGDNLVKNYPELAPKVKVATNFIGSGLVKELSELSILTDIWSKRITPGLGAEVPEMISEKLTALGDVDPELFLHTVVTELPKAFPFVSRKAPEIKSIILQERLEDEIASEPYQYEYTKLKVLEDILNPDITIFSYVGRYSPEKGMERIIFSFEKMYEEHKDIRLILIAPHGVIKEEVVKCLKASPAMSAIYVFDGMKNPYNLIANSDALVLSSYYEGLGLVALEAIASGTQVITTDLPELTRILKECGHLVSVTSTVDYDFSAESYQGFLERTHLENKLFTDEMNEQYPVHWDGEGIIVENSGRGIFYGMHYFLDNESKSTDSFCFDGLRDEAQKQYQAFIK